MKSSSKTIPEDVSSCEETVVPSEQQCEARQQEEAEENSPSKVVEEKIQRIDSEHYEEQEILLIQQKHIHVRSINTIFWEWLLFVSSIPSKAITSYTEVELCLN